MSQTLSLQPGNYALFITPPVAGADFTGTPLPSVSYQWKKNGTAIAGQTNATIGGVGVEEAGSVVSLVDGDVISIDVILTNPVSVATKTISATIDSAIPAPVISPVSVRQLSGGTYQTVTSLANTDIGEQVIVASNTGGTVTTTPPVLTTYQWRRGYGAISGATAQTYTLQASDADSIIDCVVTATNAGGTATATATVVVGTVASSGWTELTPSADSRLIYVSNSGDDVAAASAKGRGYYLPSDHEIGSDPTNPVGPIVAYASPVEASKRFRGRNWNGTDSAGGIPNYTWQQSTSIGYPDWILFRRGDSYTMPVVDTFWGNDLRTVPRLIGNWHNPSNKFSYEGGGAQGRSESERAVITAWGTPTESRPSFDVFGMDGNVRNLAIVSVETPNQFQNRYSQGSNADNLLMEDVKAGGFAAWNAIAMKNARFRRCVASGVFSGSGHNHGLFIGRYDGQPITIEECIFDRNGNREDPNDATTWTAGVVSTGSIGALPVGTGVQPTRTYYDRNIYSSEGTEPVLRGNIFSRNGGGGSVQMRQGGICERNLFIWNETALTTGSNEQPFASSKSAIVKGNVILHDDCFLPPGGFGVGIMMSGPDDQTQVADGNIVAHFHRPINGSGTIQMKGRSAGNLGPQSRLLRAVVLNNAVHHQFGALGIRVESPNNDNATPYSTVGVLNADVVGNSVSTNGTMSSQGDSSKPATFNYSGNRFHTASGGGLFTWGGTTGGFSGWQAAGFDSDGTFTNDFAAFKAAAGWTAPERDIVSYMQSVDPTYVVSEDVYVDEESAVKQSVRKKVWEVLANRSLYPTGVYWDDKVMDEARAKQAARRYHAFITFIQRAKANRKGAWDTRWTAEAVNNYIREGFGKTPLTGPYDARSLEARILEYAS